jgi:hypothetical protein
MDYRIELWLVREATSTIALPIAFQPTLAAWPAQGETRPNALFGLNIATLVCSLSISSQPDSVINHTMQTTCCAQMRTDGGGEERRHRLLPPHQTIQQSRTEQITTCMGAVPPLKSCLRMGDRGRYPSSLVDAPGRKRPGGKSSLAGLVFRGRRPLWGPSLSPNCPHSLLQRHYSR